MSIVARASARPRRFTTPPPAALEMPEVARMVRPETGIRPNEAARVLDMPDMLLAFDVGYTVHGGGW